MAAEAYVLVAAIDGWLADESTEKIRDREAIVYDRYQECGINAAKRLFTTGW